MIPVQCDEREKFQDSIVWSGKTLNLPGVAVWCSLSSRGLIGPYFFEETVTGQTCMKMIEIMIPPLNDPFEKENKVYYQQDGARPHFHAKVRNFLCRTYNQR